MRFRLLLYAALLIGLVTAVRAADTAQDTWQRVSATVLESHALPALNLSDAQRERIREAVVTKHTDIEFQLKSTKAARNFTPAIGATLPKGVKGQTLPAEVTATIPALRNYFYVTMKDQVLIVDGMSHKIIDIFSETQPVT
jgi:hypothetical protein